MDQEQDWWAAPLGAAIVVALLTSVALIAAGGWDWFVTFLGKEGSGWAQAVGSVLAIVGAYHMGRAQIKADRVLELSRRAYQDHQRLTVIDAALHRLEAVLSMIKKHMDMVDGPVFTSVNFYQEQIHDEAKTIKNFNLFDCPSISLIHALSLLPSAAEGFANNMEKYMEVCSSKGIEQAMRQELPVLENGFTAAMMHVTVARKICKERIESLEAQL